MAKEDTKTLKQNNNFISGTFKKALIPCMLSVLSANINVIVDGILVGQKLGPNALAAINICMPVNLLFCVIGSFLSAGTAINASKSIGTDATDKGNEYYKIDVVMSYFVSMIVTVIGILSLQKICYFLCSNMDVFPYVREYTLITIIGAIFRIMIYIPFWYLRLDGKNKEVMKIMSVLTVGNILLDIIFVYILDGGVFGAGLANVIATATALVLGFIYLSRRDSTFSFSLRIDWKLLKDKKIYIDGIPSSLSNLCSTIRLLVINGILLTVGGPTLVAVFTAINGVFGIGECIILGVPQASTAMLGVYYGERDNQSCKIILKNEVRIGGICSAIFFVACLALSPVIKALYGLDTSIFVPLTFMAISIFPSLLCAIISGYYNISGRNTLSSAIIILRLVVMTYVGLKLAVACNINVFSFYIFAEITTLLFIYIISGIYYKKDKDLDRIMLCNYKYEREGKAINFTIENNNESICRTCELISEFCNDNGLSIKETMKIQLAIEEALTLISQINENEHEQLDGFDVRAFVQHNVSGLRIRYDGLDFNPFMGNLDTSEYMGIKMISDLLETTIYKRTFGVNTLILLLKEK